MISNALRSGDMGVRPVTGLSSRLLIYDTLAAYLFMRIWGQIHIWANMFIESDLAPDVVSCVKGGLSDSMLNYVL